MKNYKFRILIDLPTGKTVSRIVNIQADSDSECDRLFYLWYSFADRRELIEITPCE